MAGLPGLSGAFSLPLRPEGGGLFIFGEATDNDDE